MKKNLIIAAIAIVAICQSLHSQVSIDYITGSANVTIPIYEPKGNSKNIPVSLHYNTGGVKQNDYSSNVGLGWSLNAGGAVSREMHGLPDEWRHKVGYLRGNDCRVHQAFLGEYNPVTSVGVGPEPIKTILNEEALTNSQMREIANGRLDLEPDVFSVNAPGLSAKFVFGIDSDKKPSLENPAYWAYDYFPNEIIKDNDPIVCIPNQDLRISYTREEERITSFTITNLEGYVYEFTEIQETESRIRLDLSVPQAGVSYVSSWLLTKITNPFGIVEASFYYSENPSTSEMTFYDETKTIYTEGHVEYSGEDLSTGATAPYSGYDVCDTGDDTQTTLVISRTQYKKIKTIVTRNDVIEFVYGAEREDLVGDYVLDEVRHSTSGGLYLGKCVFAHSYYNTGSSTSFSDYIYPQDYEHLMLDAISFLDKSDNLIENRTNFEYEGDMMNRNSFSIDHWGFCNNKMNPSLACEYDLEHPYAIIGPDREAGGFGRILKRIVMPNGGSQTFDYEQHKYSQIAATPILPFGVPQATGVTIANQVLPSHCTLNAENNYTIEPFQVSIARTVKLNYFVEKHTYQEQQCDVTERVFFKHIIIRHTQSQITVFDRVIGNDNGNFTRDELLWLDVGNYELVIYTYLVGDLEYHYSITATLTQWTHIVGVEDPVSFTLTAGGARLRKITVNDGDDDESNNMITRLEYGADNYGGASTGVLLSKPFYESESYNHTTQITTRGHLTIFGVLAGSGDEMFNAISDCIYHMRTAGCVNPLQSENGSFVLYSGVRVYSDENQGAKGFSEYQYNIEEIPLLDHPISSGVIASRSWRNTALRKELTYDGSGSLLSESIYEYEGSNPKAIWAQNAKSLGESGTNQTAMTGIDHDAYKAMEKKAFNTFALSTISIATSMTAPIGINTVMAAINTAIDLGLYLRLLIIDAENPGTVVTPGESTISNEYTSGEYGIFTEDFNLKKITTKEYDRNQPGIFKESSYQIADYHLGAMPKMTIQKYSGPAETNRIFQKTIYSSQFNVPDNIGDTDDEMIQALIKMKQLHVLDVPIEKLTYIQTENGDLEIVSGKIQTYRVENNLIVPMASYNLELPQPLAESDFEYSIILASEEEQSHFNPDKHYRSIGTYERCDEMGRPTFVVPRNDLNKVVIRDYSDGRVIATLLNSYKDLAYYSSFETTNHHGFTYDDQAVIAETIGHNGAQIPFSKTGNKCYKLNIAPISFEPIGANFKLTFWAKGAGIIVKVPSTGQTFESTVNVVDVLGWKFYQYEIPENLSTTQLVEISTSEAAFIDEVRYFVKDALISSVSYNDDGTVNTECDNSNFCSYYFYDDAGRIQCMMDDDRSIRATLRKYDASETNPRLYYASRVMLNENTQFDQAMDGELNSLDMLSTITFVDGIGRSIQKQMLKQSPSGKDIVSQNYFDEYGNIPRQYLPYTRNQTGEWYIKDFKIKQAYFYNNAPNITHTEYPFADSRTDNTPKQPVIEQGNVGEQWQLNQHTKTQLIALNNHTDNVIAFQTIVGPPKTNGPWILASYYSASAMNGNSIGYWPTGSLSKIETTDENGKSTIQFFDGFGRLILKRLSTDAYLVQGKKITTDLTLGSDHNALNAPGTLIHEFVDTYYIYNQFGRLIFEVSPEMLNALRNTGQILFGDYPGVQNYGIYNELGFGYTYDLRGNLIEKHSPNVAPSYFVYDDLNRLTLSQDAKQRTTNDWSFVKYDYLGRQAYSGISHTTLSLYELMCEYYDEPESVLNCGENTDFLFWESRGSNETNVDYSASHGPEAINSGISKILMAQYYDNYSFNNTGLEYSGNEELTERLFGTATGAKILVLGEGDDDGNHYLTKVAFYNRKGQMVQSKETTLMDGTDQMTYHYNWIGQITKCERELQFAPSASHIGTVQDFQYDRAGRPTAIYQKTGEDPRVQLAALEYNELSQLHRKHLHIAAGENSGMQVVDYRYNERGWLRKINNSNMADDGDNLEDDDVFGMELLYTPSDWTVNGASRFDENHLAPNAMYDGRLASIIWNSKRGQADDGTVINEKSYVYRYDDLYRLTCGAFGVESFDFATYGTFVKSVNTFMEKVDYDLHGNITHLQRNRAKQQWHNETIVVDNLDYFYSGVDRLKSVKDLSQVAETNSYIHFIDGNQTTLDYQFDGLGNVVEDANKKLQYSYNLLGLLERATQTTSGSACRFIYDATGRKLAKSASNGLTYYQGGATYTFTANQYTLVNIETGVGVVRPNINEANPTHFLYDYYLKDHLGNVRAVITEGNSQEVTEVATMELNNSLSEESVFNYLDYSRSAVSIGYPATENTGNSLSELSSNTTTQGPARLNKIQLGDEIQVSVQSWYNMQNGAPSNQNAGEIISNIFYSLASQTSGIVPENIAPMISDGSSDISTGLNSFLTDALSNEDLSAPRGYLIYLTFDEEMNLISTHSGLIGVESSNQLEFLQSEQMTMPVNGYFYTYLTNTSDQLVSFDNLTVHHKQGRVRALYDYYPYGLMWNNVRDDQYDKTFEGSEFAHGEWGMSGLNMNYFEARWYDPVIGRWHSPDPLEQFHSPYIGMANDPANFVDPDGRNAREWIKSNKEEILTIAFDCVIGAYFSGAFGGASGIVSSVVGTGLNVASVAGTVKEISQFSNKTYSGSSASANLLNVFCSLSNNLTTEGTSFERNSGSIYFEDPQMNYRFDHTDKIIAMNHLVISLFRQSSAFYSLESLVKVVSTDVYFYSPDQPTPVQFDEKGYVPIGGYTLGKTDPYSTITDVETDLNYQKWGWGSMFLTDFREKAMTSFSNQRKVITIKLNPLLFEELVAVFDQEGMSDRFYHVLEEALATLMHETNAHAIPALQGLSKSSEEEHNAYFKISTNERTSPTLKSIKLDGVSQASRDRLEVRALIMRYRHGKTP